MCNVPDTAEPYFPILFACLHEPECLSHVTCKAAKISNPKLVQHFPSHAAHEVKELPKSRNNLANNDVYKPTLCQAYCWCWVHYIKMLQKEQCLSTPHPFGTFVAPLFKKLCSTLTQSWKSNYPNQCICANITITFLFVAARFNGCYNGECVALSMPTGKQLCFVSKQATVPVCLAFPAAFLSSLSQSVAHVWRTQEFLMGGFSEVTS